jgi:hypothetical protein
MSQTEYPKSFLSLMSRRLIALGQTARSPGGWARKAYGPNFVMATQRCLKWRTVPVCDLVISRWSQLLGVGPELLRDLLAREGFEFIRGRVRESNETSDKTNVDGASGPRRGKASR